MGTSKDFKIKNGLAVGDGSIDSRVLIKKADNNTSDHIQFYNGTTRTGEIGSQDDTWLRINQVTNKNIYTPRYMRADGGFFVDGTAKGIDGSGNFFGGTITGASDANVSNWNAAYTYSEVGHLPLAGGTMTGDITFGDDEEGIVWTRNTDGAHIKFHNTEDADTDSYLEFNIRDNTNEDFLFTSTTGVTTTELLRISPDGGTTGLKFRGNTVWHAGNDGDGSGLDADKLDGVHASSFLRSDTTDSTSGSLTVAGALDAGALKVDGKQVLNMTNSSTARGPWNPIVSSIRSSGKKLFADEEFAVGTNSVVVYNNSGGADVTIVRENDSVSSGGAAPNSTGKVLKISYNGDGVVSPNYGGFIQVYTSEENHTVVQIFQAKVPNGRSLNINENATGSNSTSYWLTDNAGTGKWEWYARVNHFGDGGTFGSAGHVSVSGGDDVAFNWYLASLTAIDVTESIIGADKLDGVTGASYLRSDADDTMSEKLTFSQRGNVDYMENSGGVRFASNTDNGGELILRDLTQLRFTDEDSWDYNKWAGITYDESEELLTIGGPSSSSFTSNANPTDIGIRFDGISSATFNGLIVGSAKSHSTSGASTRVLDLINTHSGNYTTDALTCYNSHTSYDIPNQSTFSIHSRKSEGSVYTYASENATEPVAWNRFVQLDENNTNTTYGMCNWAFYQYDGSGTTNANLQKPNNKLFTINTYESSSLQEQLSLNSDGGFQVSGTIKHPKVGTATSSINQPSTSLQFESSGWDTNQSTARSTNWYIRAENTNSIYPDMSLSFYEEDPTYSHKKFELIGRGSGATYQHPDAAKFYGNLYVYDTSDNTGGSLDVQKQIKSGGVKLSEANASQNFIAFSGTTGDAPDNFNHTYVGERVYSGSEISELVLLKLNDAASVVGPDRIRHIAANHMFQTIGTISGMQANDTLETTMGRLGTPTDALYIDASAKVAVGHSSPLAQLHVYDTGSALTGIFESTHSGGPEIKLLRRGNGDTADLGQINFVGHNDATSPEEISYASIEARVLDNSDATEDGQLKFHTVSGGTSRLTASLDLLDFKVYSTSTTNYGSIRHDGFKFNRSLQSRNNQEFNFTIIDNDADSSIFKFGDDTMLSAYGLRILERGSSTANTGTHCYGVTSSGKFFTRTDHLKGKTNSDFIIDLTPGGSTSRLPHGLTLGSANQNQLELRPHANGAGTIGLSGVRWNYAYINNIVATDINTNGITVGQFAWFKDSDEIRFGSTSGGDSKMFYDGTNNDLEIELGNANNFKITYNNTDFLIFNRAAGSLTTAGNITAFSDQRLKSDIKTLDPKKTLQMRGVEFTKDGKKGSGVIAQELEKIAPELVENEGKYKSVAYGNLTGYLIETVKDQQKQIDELKELVQKLLEK